ncbi:uncharacterized protein LOC121310232 isoform X2 [Polyodon spathula]|uniref:uncharacterized protein LOC121310232 isoform X2 n=1 Tax=Polyodon spathula TaxID=7913 RepID=UPI001B7DBE4F|nr:uncharacterized protein LOC121310232 isoform X2 [Polyodon spathula]
MEMLSATLTGRLVVGHSTVLQPMQEAAGASQSVMIRNLSCVTTLTASFISTETSNITERYTLISTVKTWAEARQYCREHHTDLVSIKSASENEEIKKKAPTSPFWIGLFNDPWKWTDGGTSTFQNWGVSEPDNVLGKENCVLMYSLNNGKWEDWPCSFEFCFICYEEYNPTTSAPQTVPLSCLKQPCPSGQDCIADSCADPCHQYKVLDEPWRSTHFPVAVPSDPKCDRDLKGWYRFLADESARMPEACVPVYRCGTDAPMWLNGSHPLERDGIVIRQSCGQWNSKCCYFKTTIHVKACPGNYHVYKFQGTPGCNLAYCTESNFTTKALESTTERSTDTTERSTDTTERSTDTTERSTDTTERPTETQTSPEPGKGRRQVVRIEIKAPEGQDPEDPKIRDAILAELQEHFSKDTPKEGMTLRWIKKDGKIFHKLEEKEEEETETCSKP